MFRSKKYEKQIEDLNSAISLFESFIVEKKLEQEFDAFLNELFQEWSELVPELVVREELYVSKG